MKKTFAQRKEEEKQKLKQQEPLKSNAPFTSVNFGVKYYDLEPKGGSLDEIISNSTLKAKYNEQAKQYVQLIDEFEMPTKIHSISITNDQNYVFLSGTYAPQIRCFDLEELSLKYERHIDYEPIRLVNLSDDCSKLAILQQDRYIQFHAQFGRFYSTKIPRNGRDMIYHSSSCELITVGEGHEAFRLDLEQGIFRQPFEMKSEPDAINTVRIHPLHQLVSFGCSNGFVECADSRTKGIVGHFNACKMLPFGSNIGNITDFGNEITAVEFDPKSQVTFAVGTNMGQVGVFDLRVNRPFLVKDHYNESPILKIHFHDLTDNIISCDSKLVKIWDKNNGNMFTNIEYPKEIMDMAVMPKSGMILTVGTYKRVKPFYIPSLGPAPKWCSFIDNLTEELEETKKSAIHQEFQFLTLKDLEEYGVEDLIGTPMVRPYLHGYMMKMELFKKIKSFQNDQNESDNENEKPNNSDDNSDDEKSDRITKQYAEQKKKQMETHLKKATKQNSSANISSIFDDERFKSMLHKPEYEINPQVQQKKEAKKQKKNKDKKQEKEDTIQMHELQTGAVVSFDDTMVNRLASKRSFEQQMKKTQQNDDEIVESKGEIKATMRVGNQKRVRHSEKLADIDDDVQDTKGHIDMRRIQNKDQSRRGAEQLLPRKKHRRF